MAIITNIISAIGNNNSIYPLLVRDCGIEVPTKVYKTYNQNKQDKEIAYLATRERIIDEYSTSAVWLGGIPLIDKISNYFIKKRGFNPDVNIKLYNEEKKFRLSNGLEKFSPMDLFVNKGDLTLVFSPKECQPFYKTFDKSFVFVGTTIKDRLKRSYKKYGKYDIYVSLGSIFTENDKLLNNIINNELLKGKHVIISVGNLQMNNLPNIEFVKSTDQLALLPQLDLFINHGGLCSVYESIYFGIFQICIPQQEEHRLTAQMVEKRKIGIRVENINSLNIKKLEKFRNKNMHKLKKYQAIIKSYDGSQLAFEKIEEVLKQEKIMKSYRE